MVGRGERVHGPHITIGNTKLVRLRARHRDHLTATYGSYLRKDGQTAWRPQVPLARWQGIGLSIRAPYCHSLPASPAPNPRMD